ncbi:helix-turn-helix domain-containing protein [Allosalinactinospora lopnorensis]|uniref:helix-turn-helix domain-containing protein n=1 Tax=Allosalinactinospora lopnorensis TaxID=1352348 RepID=UPI00191BCD6A
MERLERKPRRGPLGHGLGEEFQGWTLARVKPLIGRLFHIGYTIQGVWKLLRWHGWSAQVSVRRSKPGTGRHRRSGLPPGRTPLPLLLHPA